MYECFLSERSLLRVLVSCPMTLPVFKYLRKKASGKLCWCMRISNQDSTGRGNVQYGWKRRRRRRLLSSWVNVSKIRKSRILPNKTRINCWLTTIRFCMSSKQQRRAIKTYRGGILLCDQSLTGNDLKGKALSRNLGNYFDWLTFVVTQIIGTFVVTKFSVFLKIRNQIFRCGANSRNCDAGHRGKRPFDLPTDDTTLVTLRWWYFHRRARRRNRRIPPPP